jgi:hypothetical protein
MTTPLGQFSIVAQFATGLQHVVLSSASLHTPVVAPSQSLAHGVVEASSMSVKLSPPSMLTQLAAPKLLQVCLVHKTWSASPVGEPSETEREPSSRFVDVMPLQLSSHAQVHVEASNWQVEWSVQVFSFIFEGVP